jgi:hypothetical protein
LSRKGRDSLQETPPVHKTLPTSPFDFEPERIPAPPPPAADGVDEGELDEDQKPEYWKGMSFKDMTWVILQKWQVEHAKHTTRRGAPETGSISDLRSNRSEATTAVPAGSIADLRSGASSSSGYDEDARKEEEVAQPEEVSDNETETSRRSSTRHSSTKGPGRRKKDERRNHEFMLRKARELGMPEPIPKAEYRAASAARALQGGVHGTVATSMYSHVVENAEVETPEQKLERLHFAISPDYRCEPTLAMRVRQKVQDEIARTAFCRLCGKHAGWGHQESQAHMERVKELTALEELLGEFPEVRDLSSLAAKPLFTPHNRAPTKQEVGSHWGCMLRFKVLAEQRARRTGFLHRGPKSRPQVHVAGSRVRSLTPAVVLYKGQGLYRLGEGGGERDVAMRTQDLPTAAAEDGVQPVGPWRGELPPLSQPTGWWPVLIVDWTDDGWVTCTQRVRFGTGVLVLVWVICVYQWTWETPVAWQRWVFFPDP